MTNVEETPNPQPPLPRRWALPFFTMWTGQALSLVGSRVAQFALIWWITQETGSAVVLTTLATMAFLPQVFLGPIGGALVDRWNRRTLIIVCDSMIALITAVIAVLFLRDAIQLWHLYVSTFISSCFGILHHVSILATTSLMVPKQHLTRVQGAHQVLQGGISVLAPPLGALLVSLLPLHWILGMDVATAAFAIAPLFFILIPQPQRTPSLAGEGKPGIAATFTSVWADVREGVLYIWQWPGLMALMLGGLLLNLLLNPSFTLMPILVTEHYGGGAPELGWMEGLLGVGIVAGGLLLSIWGGFNRRVLTIPTGLVIVGAGMLMLGLVSPSIFWLATAGAFLVGMGIPLIDGTLMSIIQANTDPAMQGRVLTVLVSGSQAMVPLGLILVGLVAEAYGPAVVFIAAGVLTFVISATPFLIPAIMHIEERGAGDAPKVSEPGEPVAVDGESAAKVGAG